MYVQYFLCIQFSLDLLKNDVIYLRWEVVRLGTTRCTLKKKSLNQQMRSTLIKDKKRITIFIHKRTISQIYSGLGNFIFGPSLFHKDHLGKGKRCCKWSDKFFKFYSCSAELYDTFLKRFSICHNIYHKVSVKKKYAIYKLAH